MFVFSNFFPFSGKFSTSWKFYVLRGVFRISASHQVRIHVLIVLCVISGMSNPLGHSSVKSSCVCKQIYFESKNSNKKKKKKKVKDWSI